MKEILNSLFAQRVLEREEARQVLLGITRGECNNSQVAAFLTVFLMRPVSVAELEGFRDALLELCLRIDFSGYDTIDLCGTGGDGRNTFNISTLSSFVVAAAGVKVAKHGNYGVSSVSGSSNVMEHLGYTFTNSASVLEKQLNEAGICFLHAPLFHPAMKTVAPIRKELGVKTFFNMLGPLVNPSFPRYQCTGVFNLELARLYKYLLQQSGRGFTVVHSMDGYDEVSLTSNTRVITNAREQVLEPAHFGFKGLPQDALYGGNTVESSAKIFVEILRSKGTEAQKNVVVANAALAINCAKPVKPLSECVAEAQEALVSGKALKVFEKLLSIQN